MGLKHLKQSDMAGYDVDYVVGVFLTPSPFESCGKRVRLQQCQPVLDMRRTGTVKCITLPRMRIVHHTNRTVHPKSASDHEIHCRLHTAVEQCKHLESLGMQLSFPTKRDFNTLPNLPASLTSLKLSVCEARDASVLRQNTQLKELHLEFTIYQRLKPNSRLAETICYDRRTFLTEVGQYHIVFPMIVQLEVLQLYVVLY